jgi:hypothetical protein
MEKKQSVLYNSVGVRSEMATWLANLKGAIGGVSVPLRSSINLVSGEGVDDATSPT